MPWTWWIQNASMHVFVDTKSIQNRSSGVDYKSHWMTGWWSASSGCSAFCQGAVLQEWNSFPHSLRSICLHGNAVGASHDLPSSSSSFRWWQSTCLLPLTLLFLLLPPLTVQSCSKYFANIWKLQVARSNHYSCKSCQDLQDEHAHCLCEVSTSWDVLPKVHELICHLGPWANYWAISSLQNC